MRTGRSSLPRHLALASVLSAGLAVVAAPPAHAAATDVVINEMMYHALSDLDGDDYLELTNIGTAPVDVSGWSFSGITLTLPAGTSIAPGGFLVVAKDAAQFQASYGFAPAAVYGGNLSNSGETISLRDNTAATVDTVSYLDVDPWPVTADGTGPSLELIDATLDNNDFLNWAAATNQAGRTPGVANSVRRTGLGPRITGVTVDSTTPAAGQPVTVSAVITGQASAVLRYRIDFAAEQTLTMAAVGGDTYTATIPGAAAGHLIRYRVEATNPIATTRSPRVDDTIVYRGVVATDTVTSPLPIFRWFIADADYNAITSNPTADISRPAVLAYGGAVYDNVTVNIRGQGSQTTPKPNWKFEMAKNHDLDMPGLLVEPVDEFAMQADYSDVAHGRSMLSFDAFARAGVVNTQVFPVRTQRNSAFQGVYNYLDLYDGTWREREGYDDNQFFKANINAFDSSVPLADRRFEKKTPDDNDYAPLQAFLDGVALSGAAERNFMVANSDVPQLINYAAVTAILEHVDSSTKNFYLAQDPATTRWSMLPWDLDHTLGNHCCFVNSSFVTPAEPGDRVNPIMEALLATPEWQEMYFRRLRTLVNDLLATGRMEALYDAKVGVAQADIALDFQRWPYDANQSYSQQRNLLFKGIARRRTAFSSDSRVPGNQPAVPAMVINEIQHSPASGDTAEFVELYNPNSQAIDLAGWTLSGGLSLTVQPGTVILPQQTMTFIANDPAFRSAYGSTVFVGDRYSGALAASGPLTLTRPDGSVADAITYGGGGWPTSTSGQSLELTDPAADNNDGANWALSTRVGHPRLRRCSRRHRSGRTHRRHRHRGQRHGHAQLDGPRRQRRLRHHRLPGPRGQQRRNPGRGLAARRRDGDQPDRHRADQRDHLPPPGGRHQQRRHRHQLGAVQRGDAERQQRHGPGTAGDRGPAPGRHGWRADGHGPVDSADQHRRLRDHRLPGHRAADELQRRGRHSGLQHDLTRPRTERPPTPVHARRRQLPLRGRRHQRHRHQPTLRAFRERRPALTSRRTRATLADLTVGGRGPVGVQTVAAYGSGSPARGSATVARKASRRSPLSSTPTPPVEFQRQPNHTLGVLSSASPASAIAAAV